MKITQLGQYFKKVNSYKNKITRKVRKYFVKLKSKHIKNHAVLLIKYFYFFIKRLAIITASIITIASGILTFQNYNDFSKWFNKQFQTKDYWLNIAESLAPEMDINKFNDVLGSPISKKIKPNGYTHLTYINDYFYTQAITDKIDKDKVVMYSLTLRKENFYPRIPYLYDDKSKDQYNLGKSKFIDIPDSEMVQYFFGARRFLYTEEAYYGNPANYLYYFFSINDAGLANYYDDKKELIFPDTPFINIDFSSFCLDPSKKIKSSQSTIDDSKIDFSKLRKSYFNTISITERGADFLCDYQGYEYSLDLFGPDLDNVRLFDPKNKYFN